MSYDTHYAIQAFFKVWLSRTTGDIEQNAMQESPRYDAVDINQYRVTLENLIPPQLDGKRSVMDVLVTGCGVIGRVARQYSRHEE